MDGKEWIDRYAAGLEMETPAEDLVEALLDLASTAAHASERWAVPVTCWLAGRSGVTAAEALDLARRLASPSME